MTGSASQSDRLLSRESVMERTSLSSTTIWRLIKRGEFPQSVPVSLRRVAWREIDIQLWAASRSRAAGVAA